MEAIENGNRTDHLVAQWLMKTSKIHKVVLINVSLYLAKKSIETTENRKSMVRPYIIFVDTWWHIHICVVLITWCQLGSKYTVNQTNFPSKRNQLNCILGCSYLSITLLTDLAYKKWINNICQYFFSNISYLQSKNPLNTPKIPYSNSVCYHLGT